MIPGISALWPLLLRGLKWLLELLLGWAGRKAREVPPPAPPPDPSTAAPSTPQVSGEPLKPVAVTGHDDTSAALAGVATQNIENAHANTVRNLNERATDLDSQDLDQLAASANNVYPVSSTNNQTGS